MLRLGQRSTRPTAPRTDPATTTGPDQEPEAKRLQHNDASSPGRDGRSEARTQGAPRLVSLGAREDTASGRAARPGGTRLIVLEPLSSSRRFVTAVDPDIQEDRTSEHGREDEGCRRRDAHGHHPEPEVEPEPTGPEKRGNSPVDAGRTQVHHRNLTAEYLLSFGPEVRRAGLAFVHEPRRLSASAYGRRASLRPSRVPCSAQERQ